MMPCVSGALFWDWCSLTSASIDVVAHFWMGPNISSTSDLPPDLDFHPLPKSTEKGKGSAALKAAASELIDDELNPPLR